jgi:hypothetical protein
MLTIWKSILEATNVQDIEVPGGAEFLHAREQHGAIAVWYRCDPNAPKERRKIAICGTGHTTVPPRDGSRYIGTASLHDGHLILHVFELA